MFVPARYCGACRATKLALRKVGVPYRLVVADDAVVDRLRGEGFAEFPVIKVHCGDGAAWSWSGFRRDHIDRLALLVGQ